MYVGTSAQVLTSMQKSRSDKGKDYDHLKELQEDARQHLVLIVIITMYIGCRLH